MGVNDFLPTATAPQTFPNTPCRIPGSVPPEMCKSLLNLTKPHIDSYNFMLDKGLDMAVSDLIPLEVQNGEKGPILRYWIESVHIGYPCKEDDSMDSRLLPHECRERGITYAAPFTAKFGTQVNDGEIVYYERRLGLLPVMVGSHRCHLANMTPTELVANKEEMYEMGGYFICNGLERLIRLLQVPRRHIPIALDRNAFAKRGPMYTPLGVQMKCVRPDMSSVTLTLHYLRDGRCNLRWSIRKQEFLVPVVLILKALKNTTDREIYEGLIRSDPSNTFLSDRLELLLKESKQMHLHTSVECLSYLGARFRILLDLPDRVSDVEAGRVLLDRFILVHLTDNNAKYNVLLEMMKKLYMLSDEVIRPDNADSLMNQEVLLAGHFMTTFLKEKLQELLLAVRGMMMKDIRNNPAKADLHDLGYFKKCLERNADIGKKVYYFLATGNVVSTTGLDLMQVSGFTIVAEKLNHWRYVSHFRSIHRGQFFTEMKTTAPRKLLPESWGFLCCVHTPDGAPCGLLNHLCEGTSITTNTAPVSNMNELCISIGMAPVSTQGGNAPMVFGNQYLPVFFNGDLIGRILPDRAEFFTQQLRQMKLNSTLPSCTEIVYLKPEKQTGGSFPAVYLSTDAARFQRKVIHLGTGLPETIGAFEQVYLEIACVESDVIKGFTTHIETSPGSQLSLIASLTPFSDFNQSPRNMYQCQMGKQTMGTPAVSIQYRTDNKMYRIQTPQSPLVHTKLYKQYQFDTYPQGINSVVAVISYTGYDLEDAMILNKSSYERGFAHASVYKTSEVNTVDEKNRATSNIVFKKPKKELIGKKDESANRLDEDGLPPVGLYVQSGDIVYATTDLATGKHKYHRHDNTEPAFIDDVRVLDGNPDKGIQRVSIKYRFNRNPVVGDKFSSRHGQKGVLSVLWPQVDMPFTGSGITPDCIINPNAFPSRMTIGMLIESMAGKSGAIHGRYMDATPFQFSENDRAVDYFGEQLVKAGYHYYGSEPMYSGIYGEKMDADIYIGVVYYQRLRHMVSDKSQVRATGPINQLTRQPLKGRKRHGGIRFGEMERDSIIAHGAAFLLHDRLMNSSDRHIATLCEKCGSMISSVAKPITQQEAATIKNNQPKLMCTVCKSGTTCRNVPMPYVTRYLVNELAAMNIRVTFDIDPIKV